MIARSCIVTSSVLENADLWRGNSDRVRGCRNWAVPELEGSEGSSGVSAAWPFSRAHGHYNFHLSLSSDKSVDIMSVPKYLRG